ncbi:uncharacterized protein LOC129012220 isoform X1 [Pongo pygmaeus]|uniref:uncharacterized protein LOC129012220 isoform X1 n=1 Tax=Pongo pygmaeus TaxID=9600 RepID=UPI0023E1E2D4|nr:uncharacterized protein LOC129012220 isoform X1 [Pongo pygmaeus]
MDDCQLLSIFLLDIQSDYAPVSHAKRCNHVTELWPTEWAEVTWALPAAAAPETVRPTPPLSPPPHPTLCEDKNEDLCDDPLPMNDYYEYPRDLDLGEWVLEKFLLSYYSSFFPLECKCKGWSCSSHLAITKERLREQQKS